MNRKKIRTRENHNFQKKGLYRQGIMVIFTLIDYSLCLIFILFLILTLLGPIKSIVKFDNPKTKGDH